MTETAWLPEEAKVTVGVQRVSRALDAHCLTTPGSTHCMRTGLADSNACALVKPRSHHRRGAMHIAALAAVVLTLTSCKPPERSSDPNARVGGSLTSMDYEPTDTFVRPVYVNGLGGDSAGTGGSTVLSAISLPQRWHPGLTVNVRWRRCARGTFYIPGVPQNEGCRWVEKDVPVHPYTYVGRTWLHIFADDEVLVIPSMKGPNHPDYPGAESPYKSFNKRRGIGRDD